MKRALLAEPSSFVAAGWASVVAQRPPSAPACARAEPGVPLRPLAAGTAQAGTCITCHNETLKTGGLALDTLQSTASEADAETWEKVVRKVRAGLMPPAGAKRPPRGDLDAFAGAIEGTIDHAAANDPNPGRTPLHRMNRAEYANAIRDLLALEVDSTTLLPADDSSHGFDNIADVLGVSPSLLERYVSAAAKISRLAVGERDAAPVQVTYTVKGDLSQNQTLEGQPLGTRGGTTVRHNFPVDGEYVIRLSLLKLSFGQVFGEGAEGEELEVTLNGERVKLFKLDEVPMFFMRETSRLASAEAAADGSARGAGEDDTRHSPRVPREGEGGSADDWRGISAEESRRERGSRSPSRSSSTYDVFIGMQYRLHDGAAPLARRHHRPVQRDRPRRDSQPATHLHLQTHVGRRRDSDAPVRFSPRWFAGHFDARRPSADVESMLGFYQQERNSTGNFEAGIEMALRRILADPEFIFRFEPTPAGASPNVPVSRQRHGTGFTPVVLPLVDDSRTTSC